MNEKDIYEIAFQIAKSAHRGQFRRDGTTPYIYHVFNVVSNVKDMGYSLGPQIVALLHDVLEDCPEWTPVRLTDSGIPEVYVKSVKILTKNKYKSNGHYLNKVSGDHFACVVKIADMLANLQDDPSAGQKKRYFQGIKFLLRKMDYIDHEIY